MDNEHLSRDLFRAIAARKLKPSALVDLGFAHLLELCPTCRREFEAWQEEHGTDGKTLEYSRVFTAAVVKLEGDLTHFAREERAAARDLERLIELPREERKAAVDRARTHFRGPHLARLLLKESQAQVTLNTQEAYHLAELARDVLNRSPASRMGYDLLALSAGHMANARRAAGALREADSHFAFVRFLMNREPVADIETLARIDELEGSLRKDQRRLAEAEELLRRAAKMYRTTRNPTAEGRALVNLGLVLSDKGDPGRAIKTTETALEKLAARRDSRLYLCARYNLAYFEFLSGAPDRAEEILETDAPLYAGHQEPSIALRKLWLEGNIAEARGETETAEEHYLRTREGFLAEGIGYDAAMVSMDLTLLYLASGRTSEVRRLAEEMYPIFEAEDVHREALAALMLFQEAARQEELTAAAVREVARYLRDARNDPEYRFRIPS